MEQFFLSLACNPYFAAAAGLSIGAGVMIIFLSKYGTKLFFPGGTSIESLTLSRIEGKIDAWNKQHLDCREMQMREFVKVGDFKEWKDSREPLWRRLNRHAHDPQTGKVIITEE